MRGRVVALAGATGAGAITGEDGNRYQYELTDLRSAAPHIGQEVDFQPLGGQAQSVYSMGGSVTQAAPSITALPQRDWVQFYLSPRGRISRREYWLYGFLVLFAVSLVLGFIPIIGAIVSLLLFWPSIALGFKRLHDRGLPGWWMFVPMIPIMLGAAMLIPAAMSGDTDGNSVLLIFGGILYLIGLVAALWLLFGVFVRRGHPGPNEYGPDPLEGQF